MPLPDNVSSILLVSLGGVGDTVMFSPVIKAVKNRYPEASIDLLVSNSLARSCYLGADGVRAVTAINTNHKSILTKVFALVVYALSLRVGKSYDLAVYEASLHPLWAVFLRLSGGIKKNILHPVVADGIAPNVAIARLFDSAISEGDVFINVSDTARRDAERECQRHGIDLCDPELILLAVYPSAHLPLRPQWPLVDLLAVVKRLHKLIDGSRFVVIGSKADGLSWEASNGTENIDANLAGSLSMSASAAVLEKCRLLVGNDGGIMHVAGAVGCPLVTIMANVPPAFRPPGRHTVMVGSPIACAPCYPAVPKDCPDFRCRDAISVDMVYEACVKLLRESAP